LSCAETTSPASASWLQRVCGLADADELLASSTVKNLVIGSGVGLSDRGVHTLKGMLDDWPDSFASLIQRFPIRDMSRPAVHLADADLNRGVT
jgi:hypothetical protein